MSTRNDSEDFSSNFLASSNVSTGLDFGEDDERRCMAYFNYLDKFLFSINST